LKRVIAIRQNENKEAKARSEKQAQRALLKSLLEEKELDKMKNLSAAQIRKQLAELEED